MPASLSLALEQPYPGLRPFEANESLLFNGRNVHTEELLRRLAANRFLAVVGASGSGKSSLVRAGLLPALYRGYLVGTTSKWRIAVMRPGSAPISELAKALGGPSVLGEVSSERIAESSFGLVNAVRNANLGKGESLLLVVDQFEELFRFRRENSASTGGAEATLFVSQLLQAADEFGAPIYVVLTMRSDFLGDCAQFPGLPEALNKGQYLIPRMTREQRREAIVDALDYFEVTITDRLVQRLLNDAGDDPDQLPVLQHALQQTYREWERKGRVGEVDLDHYMEAGTMERALHEHAEQVYMSIPAENRWIAERIFRCLTVNEGGRAVRRPAKLDRLLRVIGVAGDQTNEVVAVEIIRLFGSRANCFLVFGAGEAPSQESVIDISHESLIRKWETLGNWVRTETKGVDSYRYLRRDTGLYPAEAGLWGDPDLAMALKFKTEMGWNDAWAEQYHQTPGTTYAQVEEFLKLCIEEREAKRQREVRQRWLKRGAVFLLVALVMGAIRFVQLERENEQSAEARKKLEAQNAMLQESAKGAEARKAELAQAVTKAAEAAARAPNDANALVQLERLRRVQEEVTRNLKQREETINSSKDLLRKSEEDRSESLKTINDLQSKLQQAWDERDKAMAALGTNINPNSYYFLETTFQERETRCLESSKPYVPGDRFNGAARSDVCGNFTGQLWRFVPSTSVGYYRLQTLGSERDNRCLESWTSRMKDALGGASRMDPCGNYSGQFWKLESTRLGSYRLKSMFVEKENLCLDGGGPGPASMQPCNDGSGQRWKLVLKAE